MRTARVAGVYGGAVQTHGGQRHPEARGAIFAHRSPHTGAAGRYAGGVTARYDAHKEDKTAPYPGIAALIDALNTAGVQCAVFSNKADPLCGKIIEHYFGAGQFVLVRGSRPGVPTKPDPTGVYSLMQDLHADPASTLFVGDSDVDILTGHNAGLPAMGALWGFRGRAELTAAGADALASVPEDILEYVRTH